MVGAIVFERMFDQGGDALFEQLNRGVSIDYIKIGCPGFRPDLPLERTSDVSS